MDSKGSRKRQREEIEREDQFLGKKKKTLPFRVNALQIIKEMVKLNAAHPTIFLDEILHSIFFLGKLSDPEFSPACLVNEDDDDDDDVSMLKRLKDIFPRPFELYSTHLPKRSPFSCVLDMIVHLYGKMNDENEIIKRLQDLISKLERGKSKKNLVSSTICVSQSSITNFDKHYGVSMSTSGCHPGRIMVAASCLSSWDSYVADAVMTYYPNKTKKTHFDGTFRLPPHVRCQAFNIRLGSEKRPCRSCGNLFGLETSETAESDYGNCAEAESLSNMLKRDEEVRRQVRSTSETCTDENRETVKQSVLSELKVLLRAQKFKWVNEDFYDPKVLSKKGETN